MAAILIIIDTINYKCKYNYNNELYIAMRLC